MMFSRLLESVWRAGTYGRFAAVLGIALVAAVSLREAPLVRNVPPIRTIASRQALVRHGRIVRMTPVTVAAGENGAASRTFDVLMTIVSPEDWQLAPVDIVLEFVDADPVPAFPPDFAENDTSLIFAPGVERTARVRFPLPKGAGGSPATPKAVRLRRPRVRFILDGG